MKALLMGATGMVGQGVLRECLEDSRIASVLTLGRSVTGQSHTKLREIAQPNLYDLAPIEGQLAGIDVCFFCLGVSSFGMDEAAYTRVTYDLTLSVARTLLRLNPGMVFLYVSGASTDSTEKGRTMWARVKGRTENELLAMPFRAAYMLRPGGIVPLHGVHSKTKIYRIIYGMTAPILPLLLRIFPKYITTTEALGRKMIDLAMGTSPSRVLENTELTST
jgi:uncharacterized protein YbjT (DUF2867 family)